MLNEYRTVVIWSAYLKTLVVQGLFHQGHVFAGVRARSRLPKRPLRSRGVTSVTSVTPLQRTCLQRGNPRPVSYIDDRGFRGLQISGDMSRLVVVATEAPPAAALVLATGSAQSTCSGS